MPRIAHCLVLIALFSPPACAEPYWIAWEGDALPEEQGWERNWGDWEGQYHGDGAIRTLEDGVMTMDSLYDPGVFDLAVLERPFNPDPGELFVIEWRLRVDQVTGPGDPGIGFFSDDRWAVGFTYTEDRVLGGFDADLDFPVSSGQFHDYRATSWDMRTYEFFVDGELVHQGVFDYGGPASTLSWGDGTQGAASLHHWDYFRVGVIPEPGAFGMLLLGAAWCTRRRAGT